LRRILSQWPEFAEACAAALNDPTPAEPVKLPEAELAPASVPPAPPLRAIDASLTAELDRFAAETLRAYLAEPRTIWDFGRPELYDPTIDTWATRGDWVRVAEQTLHQEWVHPMAVRILLDSGDPRGDELGRRYLARAEIHEGVGDADVEIVWRYRREFPEVARQWFSPSAGDDVPFSRERAKLGDPVAVRFVTIDNDGDPLAHSSSLARLDGPAREEFHRTLISWARNSSRWSPPDSAKLRAALRMGWRDVADELENNPYLLPGLLTRERREGQFDEPGMLLAKDFLLIWSRLSPGPFLAQILATAYCTDLLAAAEEASRESLAANPQPGSNPPHVRPIYESWLKDAYIALSIAWTRCRPHDIREGNRPDHQGLG
jgi:hypothetical protein